MVKATFFCNHETETLSCTEKKPLYFYPLIQVSLFALIAPRSFLEFLKKKKEKKRKKNHNYIRRKTVLMYCYSVCVQLKQLTKMLELKVI